MKELLFAFVFISFALAMFYSCKKDSVKTASLENELTIHSKKVIKLINQFELKMNNNLKAGEMIDIDSAVWNLEALQNYDYAFPDSTSRDFKVFRSYYTISIDANNKVLLSDVQLIKSQMEDTLANEFETIQSELKHLSFTDVVLDSVVGNTAFLSVLSGFGFNWLIGTYWGFEDDDDWYWGTLGQEYGASPIGKCDGTQFGVSDASDELQWRLNNPVFQPSEPYILTDIVTLSATGFEWENGDPLLYVGWDYPLDNCLTNDMLTDYLLNSHDIIHAYNSNGGLKPTGLTFAGVEIFDRLLLIPSSGKNYHHYEVSYGIQTIIGLPD